MQDSPRQPDRPRELVVDVNRVEVTGRTRVANGDVGVGRHPQLDPVALAQAHCAPRTMFVQTPVQTGSPCWLTDSDSNT